MVKPRARRRVLPAAGESAWQAVGRALCRLRNHRLAGASAICLLAWTMGLRYTVGDLQHAIATASAAVASAVSGALAPPSIPAAAGDYCAALDVPAPAICTDAQRQAVAPNPDGRVLHAPSVSVQAIWRALREAGSPLDDDSARRNGRGYAAYIWDAGRAWGVDPAILMGMFNAESNYGRRGVARLTHSPGNMRATTPAQPNVEGYASYPDWFAGIDATYALLHQYAAQGATTIDAAIPIWAPSSDHNDPAAYITIIQDTMESIAAGNG